MSNTIQEQIQEKLIKKISLRVKELIEKVEKKSWNEATLYTFQVGLSGDIEEAIKQGYQVGKQKAQKEFEKLIKKIGRKSYYGLKGNSARDEIIEELKSKIIGEKWKQLKKKI